MRPALILNPKDVASIVEAQKKKESGPIPIVTTSGGFDPLHVGHVRCIRDSSKLKGKNGLLIVIVNGDGFLMRKKGFVFMPLAERMELISHLKGVDYVVAWDDGTQFVTGAIEIIKPNIFAKGGDRSMAENVPEYEPCLAIGCTVVFGMGGSEKIQSSSELVSPFRSEDAKTGNKQQAHRLWFKGLAVATQAKVLGGLQEEHDFRKSQDSK